MVEQQDTEAATSATPKGETYKLSLKGGGLTVDREVDEATAFQILAVVMGGATLPRAKSGGTASAHAPDLTPSRPSAAGRLSLREHMDEFDPKRNPDKILAIAAYLVDTRGMETFTPDDVKKEFRNAAERVPANYSRDWTWTVSNGWIAKADDEPGEFYITLKGSEALSQKFSADVKKATSSTRRRRTKKKTEETKTEATK
jgi:hypothetical protein